MSQLQEKVKKLTETQGFTVEQSLHEDLVTIMDQHKDSIGKQYKEDSFEIIFWKQQCPALQTGTGVQ